jgi:hypothetical protein
MKIRLIIEAIKFINYLLSLGFIIAAIVTAPAWGKYLVVAVWLAVLSNISVKEE